MKTGFLFIPKFHRSFHTLELFIGVTDCMYPRKHLNKSETLNFGINIYMLYCYNGFVTDIEIYVIIE